MKNLQMFCITLNPKHLTIIKDLNYLPVGLGDNKFSDEWFNDKKGDNISIKNPFYGEYTFHYWLWKNYLDKIDNNWIGFCQYRKFWIEKKLNKNFSYNEFKNAVIKNLEKYKDYDVILGEPFFVNQLRLTKFVKKIPLKIFSEPSLLYNEKKRNIKFHFDLMHGENNLNKAIELLDHEDKIDFKDFVKANGSFNPHNMFICKSKENLKKYYERVFDWLEKCEDLFGFNKTADYGKKRIYGFLAERFLSYWFQKNTKYKTLPILFKDISDFKS